MGHVKIPVERIDKAWDGGRCPPTEYSDGYYAALSMLGIVSCKRCGEDVFWHDTWRLCSECYRDGKNRGWTIYPVEES